MPSQDEGIKARQKLLLEHSPNDASPFYRDVSNSFTPRYVTFELCFTSDYRHLPLLRSHSWKL